MRIERKPTASDNPPSLSKRAKRLARQAEKQAQKQRRENPVAPDGRDSQTDLILCAQTVVRNLEARLAAVDGELARRLIARQGESLDGHLKAFTLDELREERSQLASTIARAKANRPVVVTDHAVVSMLARAMGIDLETDRAQIAALRTDAGDRSAHASEVSDRDVLRFVEREYGIDAAPIRAQIIGDVALQRIVAVFGDGEFPFEAEGRAMRAVVRDRHVVDVFPASPRENANRREVVREAQYHHVRDSKKRAANAKGLGRVARRLFGWAAEDERDCMPAASWAFAPSARSLVS